MYSKGLNENGFRLINDLYNLKKRKGKKMNEERKQYQAEYEALIHFLKESQQPPEVRRRIEKILATERCPFPWLLEYAAEIENSEVAYWLILASRSRIK